MSRTFSSQPAHPLRIFVVENHADTLEYLQIYLEGRGHAVESARSLEEALQALPAADCDALISDIGLPDGTGWDLLRQVRGKLPRPIYAIAMSGFGMNADREHSRQAGFRQHLLKPFNPVELDAMLAEAARELAEARSSVAMDACSHGFHP